MLRKLGVEVVQAWDGQQAVAASEKQRFDLVFMDLQMPVMDGYAFFFLSACARASE